jgi:hypothetical protein
MSDRPPLENRKFWELSGNVNFTRALGSFKLFSRFICKANFFFISHAGEKSWEKYLMRSGT